MEHKVIETEAEALTEVIENGEINITMQESKMMDFRKLEDVMKQPEDFSLVDKKENVVSNFMADLKHHQLDSGSALQMFLDHIPISSIPGIKNSPGTRNLFLPLNMVSFYNSFKLNV